MKTIYGIKQKYDLKNYVRFYASRNGKGERCNEKCGYINEVTYSVALNGEIQLTYAIGDVLGLVSGSTIVPEEAILGKTKEPVKNYNYKKFLENRIKNNEKQVKELLRENKRIEKQLEEF